MKNNVWKGGPKSSRSYKMDQFRISSQPWEKKGKGVVRAHYSKSKKGKSFVVKTHRRRK